MSFDVDFNLASEACVEMQMIMEEDSKLLCPFKLSVVEVIQKLVVTIHEGDLLINKLQKRYACQAKVMPVHANDYPDRCRVDWVCIKVSDHLGYLNCPLCQADIGKNGYRSYKIYNLVLRKYLRVHAMNIHCMLQHGFFGLTPYRIHPLSLCAILDIKNASKGNLRQGLKG
jgi:hypothetical protein